MGNARREPAEAAPRPHTDDSHARCRACDLSRVGGQPGAATTPAGGFACGLAAAAVSVPTRHHTERDPTKKQEGGKLSGAAKKGTKMAAKWSPARGAARSERFPFSEVLSGTARSRQGRAVVGRGEANP